MIAKEILEKNKLDQTYWGRKIIAAEKRGEFTQFNVDEAGEWQTCACGRQDPRIPKENDRPRDKELYMAGVDFFKAVESDEFAWAAEILVDIERRATQVLYKATKGKR